MQLFDLASQIANILYCAHSFLLVCRALFILKTNNFTYVDKYFYYILIY